MDARTRPSPRPQYAIFEIADCFIYSTEPAAYAEWLRSTLDSVTNRLGPPDVRHVHAADGTAYTSSVDGANVKLVLKPTDHVKVRARAFLASAFPPLKCCSRRVLKGQWLARTLSLRFPLLCRLSRTALVRCHHS